MRIRIDGQLLVVDRFIDAGPLPTVRCTDGSVFLVAESPVTAGHAARALWEDMLNDDPDNFCTMVGAKTLISWALGNSAGPGYEAFDSLNDWLDYIEQHPEDDLSMDQRELKVDRVGKLAAELGFVATVAYQTVRAKRKSDYERALQQGKRYQETGDVRSFRG